MVKHAPFRLVMAIASPIILKAHAPSLDGLVYAALQSHLDCDNDIINEMKAYLTWNEAGFFHASSMTMVATNEKALTATSAVRIDTIKQALTKEFIAPTRANNAYSRIVVNGGPYKTRMTTREAYCVPYVTFDGHGAANRVVSLLSHYLHGVGYDAQNNGQGEVTSIDIVDLTQDLSISIGGNVVRTLPYAYAVKHNLTGVEGKNCLIPPYYHDDKQHVIMPEKIRIKHHMDAATGQ